VNSAAITNCVSSQRVFIVVSVYFVLDSVRKLLDTPRAVRKQFSDVITYLGFLYVSSCCIYGTIL
jgi:hypothetical protein